MINQKALMLCLTALVILSSASFYSCANKDVSSEPDTDTSITLSETIPEESSEMAVSSIPDTSSEDEKKVKIEAAVRSYEDGILCFEYEGKEYSLPMTKDMFENEIYLCDTIAPNISERIINNNLGEDVSAKIVLNESMDRIILCDVIKADGKIDNGMSPYNADNTVNEDMLYTMKRTGKSSCKLSNSEETIVCDLNDLPLCKKLDYPETVFPVMLWVYKFNDGKAILLDLDINVQVDADRVSAENDLDTLAVYGRPTGFFGTVQTVDDDTITVLLNDGITYCTVPTFYNDGGELASGSEIMVLLNTESDLFGKGGEFTFDHAVIVTDPGYCVDKEPIDEEPKDKDPIDNFNEYAYAVFYNSWDHLSCTRIDEIEKK